MPEGSYVALNLPVGVRNASDKRVMKHCFIAAGIPTAPWWWDPDQVPEDAYPIVAKHRMGSRGTGVYLLNSQDGLKGMMTFRGEEFFRHTFILEKYLRYPMEFRVHATQREAFYSNRKALKHNTPDYRRWKYTYEDSVWLREDNKEFHKPKNWAEICQAAIASVRAVGLDVGACDIKVEPQGDGPANFFILEVNSAPSFGDLTANQYTAILPKLAKQVAKQRPYYSPQSDPYV